MALRNRTPAETGADRLAAAAAAVRPYVDLARDDPELQAALREAVAAGSDVSRELSGVKPEKAARRLARDRDLQARIGAGARALGESALIVRDERRKARRHARAQALLAAMGALSLAGLGAVAYLRRRRAGEPAEDAFRGDPPTSRAGQNGGAPVEHIRPAGSPSP